MRTFPSDVCENVGSAMLRPPQDFVSVRMGIKFGKSEAFVNDCLYMRTVVCLVEVFVSGDNLRFDVVDKCLGYHASMFLLESKNTKRAGMYLFRLLSL